MALGYRDLKSVIQLPGTWDKGYLQRWALQDGTTFDQVVERIGAALVLFNRSLRSGYFQPWLYVTTEPAVRYGVGDSDEMPRITDQSRLDPIHGAGTGHMLPLWDHGRAMGWTKLALRRMTLGKMTEDIQALIAIAGNTWEKALFRRLFQNTADAVGDTGKSVPFCDGGVADATYVPPSVDGKVFANTHTHYLRYASASLATAAEAMAAHLLEHGHRPPYDLVIADADKATWTALDDFVKPERGLLSTAGVETRAAVAEDTYIGVLEVDSGWFRVKPSSRLPTNYAGAFKVYRGQHVRSPLAVRYEPGYPLGLLLESTNEDYPLVEADVLFTFGVGVKDRTAGVCLEIDDAGDYASPAIS